MMLLDNKSIIYNDELIILLDCVCMHEGVVHLNDMNALLRKVKRDEAI